MTAVSRKVHAAAGPFDINLPTSGTPGVECRTGGVGGVYQVVITFGGPVTVGGLSITSIDGLATAAATVSGAVVTVNLSGVANAQTLGITLTNVGVYSDFGNVSLSMGVLLGDTTRNGSVSASDISLTKSISGQPVSSTNFFSDVNVSGTLNSSDISLVKAQSGTHLP
jgi:hypothetical protein